MEFSPGPEIIFRYFPDLNPIQQKQFRALSILYAYWNQRINVISRKDMEGFYQNHVLHSLGIAKVFNFKGGEKVLDVGTGGGFPGIPLAILYPDVRFDLIDSIGKKVKVAMQVIKELELKNVNCRQIRAEDEHSQYDVIVSRAVTRLARFIPWVSSNIKPGGHMLFLKGGELDDEIAEAGQQVLIYELNQYFEGTFFETKKVLLVPSGR